MQPSQNKQLVLTFVRQVLGACDLAALDALVNDFYIQHNPTLPDGKEGLRAAIQYLKQLSPPGEAPRVSPLVRILAEGDWVMTHMDVPLHGTRKAVIDLYRIQDGKLAEHWDAIEEQPEPVDPGVTMTNGQTTVEDLADAEENACLVHRWLRQPEVSVCEPGLIGHHPVAGANAEELVAHLARREATLHRMLTEGNFVMVQSSGKMAEKPSVFYDLYRVAAGKIAEHWAVMQEIPAKMPHPNGMI